MDTVDKKIRDLERRIIGLKGDRFVNFSQLDFFEEVITGSFEARIWADEYITVEITCAGVPLADAGFSSNQDNSQVVFTNPAEKEIDGNIFRQSWVIFNDGENEYETVNYTITALAANGLSARVYR